jgi:hypothetical protein
MAERQDTFLCVWDGDVLVDIFIPQTRTAADRPTTNLDRELVRIFREHREMKERLRIIDSEKESIEVWK